MVDFIESKRKKHSWLSPIELWIAPLGPIILLLYSTTYSTRFITFNDIFQQLIHSSTRVSVTIIIALCWHNKPFTEADSLARSSRCNQDPRMMQAKNLTMSDVIKAQQTPQFNWYTCWTSLSANSMPDKLTKEGMKQPDQIKITFEKGTKDITGHAAPDQAQFGPKYFLEFTLLDLSQRS